MAHVIAIAGKGREGKTAPGKVCYAGTGWQSPG